jgi:hypothetical protein
MIDLYRQKQRIFGGFAVSHVVGTGDTTASFAAPALKTTSHILYVQRIKITVTTGAAQTLALAGASGAPVLTPAMDMSTAGVSFTFDFGPAGRALVVNELIKATISAAGAGAVVAIDGYSHT